MPRGVVLPPQLKQAILQMHLEGYSIRNIAFELNTPRSTVGDTIHKHTHEGDYSPGKKRGRPFQTTPRVDRRLLKKAKTSPFLSCSELSNICTAETGSSLSKSSERTRLLRTAAVYRRVMVKAHRWILGNRVHPELFVHDNAPPHRAATTDAWFAMKGQSLLKLPPRSPDLNPIETLWAEMARRMRGKVFLSNVELWKGKLAVKKEIPRKYILKLFRSCPKRVSMCLAHKGGHTKW